MIEPIRMRWLYGTFADGSEIYALPRTIPVILGYDGVPLNIEAYTFSMVVAARTLNAAEIKGHA